MAPVYDPQEPVSPGQKRHGPNLEAYREWLLSKRADGWDLVDTHGQMRRDLDAAKKKRTPTSASSPTA